jgi:hypothetical protein
LINTIMPEKNEQILSVDLVRKWTKIIASSVAIVIAIGSVTWNTAIWIDSRYIYKSISDQRWIDTQIMVLKSDIREYNRHVASGNMPSEQEVIDYDLTKSRLQWLLEERDKLMGMGDDER